MKHLEKTILQKIHDRFKELSSIKHTISLSQFYGIDINPLAVELTMTSLAIAKIQSPVHSEIETDKNHNYEIDFEQPLPLDNLDIIIICDDALFSKWPSVDSIIGKPSPLGGIQDEKIIGGLNM